MNADEIYLLLATNKIAISEALALAKAYIPLTSEEGSWVDFELNGYDGKLNVPEYRQFPCELKAKVEDLYRNEVYEVSLVGNAIQDLDFMLNNQFGITIFKMYVSQGVEPIEKQVSGHNDGDIIMIIDGPSGRDLKEKLSPQAQFHNCTIVDVLQSAPIAYMQNTLSVIKHKLMDIISEHIKNNKLHKANHEDKAIERKKSVFISYCWESEEHKEWVKKLAKDLSDTFVVKIDQKLPYGIDLMKFMEEAIASSDKVLIITTPEYKRRADNRERGVGYETSLITDDLITEQNIIKFIPIIRKGNKETSYPKYLGSRLGADMTNDKSYFDVLNKLKHNLQDY